MGVGKDESSKHEEPSADRGTSGAEASLITEARLDEWMRTAPQAPGLLADLLWRLVVATCPTALERRFPRSDSIGQPGLDGILVTPIGVPPYIPQGRSVWEFGTSNEPGKKATSDYRKRTKKEPLEDRLATTFVFVTPLSALRGWTHDRQRRWVNDRKKKGEWRDVKVIDGTALVDWLDHQHGVMIWLAEQMGLPTRGAATPAQRWRQCSEISAPHLSAQVFLTQREAAVAALRQVFAWERRTLLFACPSRDELIPFVAAYVAQLSDGPEKDGAQRCVIVRTPEAWSHTCSLQVPHILVADFDFTGADAATLLAEARLGNHSVICHVPAGTPDPGTLVELPLPDIHAMAAALHASGFDSERARDLANRAGGRTSLLVSIIMGAPLVARVSSLGGTNALAVATLVGNWREDAPADISILNTIANDSDIIDELRTESQTPGSPLTHDGAFWSLASRYEAWQVFGPRIYDDQLARFETAAVDVLREKDPQFDLPPQERYMAGVLKKTPTHSRQIRHGVANTLALLGAAPEALTSASSHRPTSVARSVVRRVLADADWVTWASLQDVLPQLAEAAPDEVLEAMEQALLQTPCPFDELFAQEGSGFLGRTYMTGTLWALETIAWEPTRLTRVGLVLAELARHDPGGSWSNRPSNSLAAIFKPWFPQTPATIEERERAVRAIVEEEREVGWKLILDLLPKSHDIGSQTRRPTWRAWIPDNWKDGASAEDRRTQFSTYSRIAIDIAKSDSVKLAELAERIDDLPNEEFDAFVAFVGEMAEALSDEARYPLWAAILDVVSRHVKVADADWAMPEGPITALKVVADKVAPRAAVVRARRLFVRREHDLFDERGSYEEQRRRLQEVRTATVRSLLEVEGIDSILELALKVEAPESLGWVMGTLGTPTLDERILPEPFSSDDAPLARFAQAYANAGRHTRGWEWVDSQLSLNWTSEQKARLLLALPFSPQTWERVERFLGKDEHLYWSRCSVHAYGTDEKLAYAAEKLKEHGRPRAAIECLSSMEHSKTAYDRQLAIDILLAAASSREPRNQLDTYHVRELIGILQKDDTLPELSRGQVEFAYIPLLDHDDKARPLILERTLARDPEFFLGLLRAVFRSTKEEKSSEPDEREALVAKASYMLLSAWRLIPGTREDGTIDAKALEEWVAKAKTGSEASGYRDLAVSQIGRVLAHAPEDPSGLWIDKGVAKILNARDGEVMRDGFRLELYNSRGAFSFTQETAGKEEDALAAAYRAKADAVDAAGFSRLAAPLRQLAEDYERQAKDAREDRLFRM